MQKVHMVTEVKRDNAEELGQTYKLLKAWKTQNREPEYYILHAEVLVHKRKKPNLNKTAVRVTLLVAFFMDWKKDRHVRQFS